MLRQKARLRTVLQGALLEMLQALHLEDVVLDLHVQLDAPPGFEDALVKLNPTSPILKIYNDIATLLEIGRGDPV